MKSIVRWLICVITAVVAHAAQAADWPQFRGVNASGLAADGVPLPVDIAPDRHVIWKTALPRGHSSPVVVGDRVFVTGYRDPQLVTIAIDRRTGEILWEAEAEYKKLERFHRTNSPATPTPVADDQRVITFFGSCGLFCYDHDGRPLWRVPMGPFDNGQGASSSPILVDDLVITVQDHDTGSFLAAYDKRDGSLRWRVDRANFRRNYSTPTVWKVDGRNQVVVAGSSQINAYDAANGAFLWTVAGIARVVSSTPIVGGDGRLYLAASGGSSEVAYPTFDEVAAASDANGDGLLSGEELPEGPLRSYQDQFDRDKNKLVDRQEYESIRHIFSMSRDAALSIRPGARGDATDSHVAWATTKLVPRNASPAYYDGTIFLVKDGGIVTTLDAETGRTAKQGRSGAVGSCFSSPVVGGGYVYMFNEAGDLTVISAEPRWRIVAQAKFGEDVYATPAIVGGRIYVRTVNHLYCFGLE